MSNHVKCLYCIMNDSCCHQELPPFTASDSSRCAFEEGVCICDDDDDDDNIIPELEYRLISNLS